MANIHIIKYLTILLFLASAVFFQAAELLAVPSETVIIETPHASRLATQSDVKPLFKKHCARCHGADGSADTESGRIYETPDISGGKLRNTPSAKLVRIVTNGKESMPSFKKKLSAAQIRALTEHMRTL